MQWARHLEACLEFGMRGVRRRTVQLGRILCDARGTYLTYAYRDFSTWGRPCMHDKSKLKAIYELCFYLWLVALLW